MSLEALELTLETMVSLLILLLMVTLEESHGVVTVEERAVASVVGSFVADAATMPLHWIYDNKALHDLVKARPDLHEPAFFPVPSCPFYPPPQYNYRTGESTPYGHAALIVLESISSGAVIPEAIAKSLFAEYGASGSYSGFRDGSTRGFVKNMAAGTGWPSCGADDSQANALTKIAPVVALRAGELGMLKDVEAVIRVTQNSDLAVAFGVTAARILEKAVLGQSFGLRAIHEVVEEMRKPNRTGGTPHDGALADKLAHIVSPEMLAKSSAEVVGVVGSSCGFPNNLLSGAHYLAKVTGWVPKVQGKGGLKEDASPPLSLTPNFEQGVNDIIMQGGDNASRNMFVAAVLAAMDPAGLKSIPGKWQERFKDYKVVEGLARRLVAKRHARLTPL